jgi:eukaryotic-like serine/threonine-protein kinase
MLEGNPIILFKIAGITALVILFIRLFARKMPINPLLVTPSHLPSDRRLDRYLVMETIGVGGNATVYRAKSDEGETVAIKVPHLETMRTKHFRKIFETEASAGIDLVHPSIVKVFGTGEFKDPGGKKIPFIVMEALEGEDLRDVLKREGLIKPKEAAQIARVVADTLGWAHSRGVIHRDVSPQNIFLTKNRQIKVMDFGISTAFKRGDKKGTGGGALNFGTPAYLAPERTSRTDNDPRSDLYSLGCVLYEMVTGQPPFTGESPKAVLMLHRRQSVSPPSKKVDIPKGLEEIIMKLLEKDPDKRYQDAGAVTAALADLIPAV